MKLREANLKQIISELEGREHVKSTRVSEEEGAKIIVSGENGEKERYIRQRGKGIILMIKVK